MMTSRQLVTLFVGFAAWLKGCSNECNNHLYSTGIATDFTEHRLFRCSVFEENRWYSLRGDNNEVYEMIKPQRGACLEQLSLWLRDPLPRNSRKNQKEALNAFTSMRPRFEDRISCKRTSPTKVEIIWCSRGYFIYNFGRVLDDTNCIDDPWVIYALKVSTVLPRSSFADMTLSPSPQPTSSTPEIVTITSSITSHSASFLPSLTLSPATDVSSSSSTSSTPEIVTITSSITSHSASFLPSLTLSPATDVSSSSHVSSSSPVTSSSTLQSTITLSVEEPTASQIIASPSSTYLTTTGWPTSEEFKANFIVKLTKLDWSPEFVNQGSPLRAKLVENIIRNIEEFYTGDKTFWNVTVNLLRKGSVISEFTISYKTLNSIQILKLQEHVTVTGNISKLPAQILTISSDKVPSTGPVILHSSSVNSTAIRLKWTSVSVADLSGYQVFYKKSGSRFDRLLFTSLSSSVTQAVISGLSKFTRYTFRVLASSSNGNGVASEPVTLSTDEDVPSLPPNNLQLIVYSSTRIGLVWDAITEHQANGILFGYNVSLTWFDKIDHQLRWNHSTATPTGGSAILLLEDLQKYTKYTFKVCGFTSKGCGPWSHNVAGTTYGDVPSQPPSNITYLNFTSTSSATIWWDPIPSGHINGILRGYQVSYQLTTQSELPVEEAMEITTTIGPNIRSLKLSDLQAHSIYRVKISGINDAGIGVAQNVFIETCRCPKTLYTNYWANPPYLIKNTTTNLIGGIFPNIVTQMLTWACGVCTNGHGNTMLNMTSNGRGMTSMKDSVVGVIDDIDEVPRVSFPIYGNKDIQKYKGSHQYVHVVDSPGIAFITIRQPTTAFSITRTVISCLPLIGLVMCMTYISGFVIWLLDSRFNKENFPPKFTEGVREGFWWSFITITTVGYGDRHPVGVIGRSFGLFWTLMGIVIISVLIGTLTTSLTTITMDGGIIVYGTKTTVIENSTEHRVGILMNAKIKKEYLCNNITCIKDNLDKGDVRGALMDSYVAADQKNRLFKDNIRVKKLLDKKIGYGVVLSGEAQVIRKRCNDFMKRNVEEISKVIQKYTSTLEPPLRNEAVEKSTGLFDSKSNTFKEALNWLIGGLIVTVISGIVWEIIWRINQRKVGINSRCVARIEAEMKDFINKFYRDFNDKVKSLRAQHKRDRQQLIQMKKNIKKTNTFQLHTFHLQQTAL